MRAPLVRSKAWRRRRGGVLLEQMGAGLEGLLPAGADDAAHACTRRVAATRVRVRQSSGIEIDTPDSAMPACAASQSLSPPAKPRSISRLWKTLYASR